MQTQRSSIGSELNKKMRHSLSGWQESNVWKYYSWKNICMEIVTWIDERVCVCHYCLCIMENYQLTNDYVVVVVVVVDGGDGQYSITIGIFA